MKVIANDQPQISSLLAGRMAQSGRSAEQGLGALCDPPSRNPHHALQVLSSSDAICSFPARPVQEVLS